MEANEADRADIPWYGGKIYIKAAELANAEAFAANVRNGEKDAGVLILLLEMIVKL